MTQGVLFNVSPLAIASGDIIAVRVQDIPRNIFFSWDDPPGTWDELPSCTPGAGNLYVAFYAVNPGDGREMTLSLEANGQVLATKTEFVATNGSLGLEWTGNMPNSNISMGCYVE